MSEKGNPNEQLLTQLGFDEHGLPVGQASERVWPPLLLSLDANAEKSGWDQPSALFAIQNPVQAEARFFEESGGRSPRQVFEELNQPTEEGAGFVLGIDFVQIVEGDYWQTLFGVRLDDAAAIAFVTEVWQHGSVEARDSGIAPSQDPNRIEARMVRLMTRSGHGWILHRPRNQEPKVIRSEPSASPLDTILARILGIEPAGDAGSLGEHLAGRVLYSTIAMLRDMKNPPSRILKDNALHDIHEALEQINNDQTLLENAAFMFQLESIKRLAWICTDSGKRSGADWTVLESQSPIQTQEQLTQLSIACHIIAEEGFTGLDFDSARGTVLPPWMTSEKIQWAEEKALSQIMEWKFGNNNPALLNQLADLAGAEAAERAKELFQVIGWDLGL